MPRPMKKKTPVSTAGGVSLMPATCVATACNVLKFSGTLFSVPEIGFTLEGDNVRFVDLFGSSKRNARMSALSNPDWDRFVDAVSIQACVETKVDSSAYAPKTTSFSGADYLIIVPDALEDTVAPLAEWKHRKGLRVKVTPLSDIGVNPDTAAIKAYVQNAYDT